MFKGPFPRKLKDKELDIILRILPDNKSGYSIYNKLISEYFLIGEGNTPNSIILSRDQNFINSAPFITPVFAAGTFAQEDKEFNIAVHEELDDSIEVEIDLDEPKIESKDIIYSEWNPGMKAPGDFTGVREIIIEDKKYILAVAPLHKKLWLHNITSGVNHLLSSGPFYSAICFLKKIKDPDVVFKTALLFEKLDSYSDNELISAFHLYNKSTRRFKIEIPVKISKVNRRGFLSKLFFKDKK